MVLMKTAFIKIEVTSCFAVYLEDPISSAVSFHLQNVFQCVSFIVVIVLDIKGEDKKSMATSGGAWLEVPIGHVETQKGI